MFFERGSDISELSAFEVRSIQAAKSKRSSCPRKKPAVSCGPCAKRRWKVRTVFRLKKFVLYCAPCLPTHQRKLDTVGNAPWVNNPMRFQFTRPLVAFRSLTRRPKIRLQRNFAHIFDDINTGHRTLFCPQFFGLPYLHMVIDEDNKVVAFSDRVPE